MIKYSPSDQTCLMEYSCVCLFHFETCNSYSEVEVLLHVKYWLIRIVKRTCPPSFLRAFSSTIALLLSDFSCSTDQYSLTSSSVGFNACHHDIHRLVHLPGHSLVIRSVSTIWSSDTPRFIPIKSECSDCHARGCHNTLRRNSVH